jgi:hypothetical protein
MSGIVLSRLEKSIDKIVASIRSLNEGRSAATGEITLRPGFTTTIVTKQESPGAINVSLDSTVHLSPKTASASTVVWWISNVDQGTFTVTHPASAALDQIFGWSSHG